MAFVAENRLEHAMVRAQVDVLARPEFYRLLMTEPLIVAGMIARGPGAPEGLNLAVVRHNGRSFHPIFTSLARLKAVAPDENRHFAALGRDLFSRTAGADFLLNPNSELGKPLMASEIAFWLDPSARARRRMAANPRRAKVAPLAEPPAHLTDALRILFENRGDVISAHLLEVSFSDRDEPPHPLIVIETAGAWDKIYTEISELAAAVVPDAIIDVVPLGPEGSGYGVPSGALAAAPFYQRTSTE